MNIIPNKTQIDNAIFECCTGFFNRFKINKKLHDCCLVKSQGVMVKFVFLFLLGLVFSGKNLNTLINHYSEKIPFGKDVVYRLLKLKNVNWERLTFNISNDVIPEINKLTSDDRRCALVIDDTTQYRNRSKKIEMLAKCYDHCENRYYNGHSLLTMGWTDGQTFMPVDYRVLSASDDKNLIHGSNIIEDNRTIATRRRKDARRGKPALVLDMLKNAKHTNAQIKYVLFDSWFANPTSIIQIKHIGYDVVAQLKKDKTHYIFNGENLPLNKIFSQCKKRPGKAKYLLSVMVEIHHKEHGTIPAKIVFVRNRANKKEWIAIITTDLSLNEEEIIALYGKRWSIEVFFKVCKSYLKLGTEFQCHSFDSISALVAIVFIRYMKLAVDNRESNDDRSLGELFMFTCKELEDISFIQALRFLLASFVDFTDEYLCLKKSTISKLVDDFIMRLPSIYADWKVKCRCEN